MLDLLAARDRIIAASTWAEVGVPDAALTALTDVAPDEIARLEEQGMNGREIATRLYAYGAAIGIVASLPSSGSGRGTGK